MGENFWGKFSESIVGGWMTVAANFIFKAVHTFEKHALRPSQPLNFTKKYPCKLTW